MKFQVTDQEIKIIESQLVVSGTVNIYYAEFTFDSSWSGYATTIVFRLGNRTVYNSVLDSNNRCIIPSAVLVNKGSFRVGAYGVKGTGSTYQRKPTVWTKDVILREGCTEGIDSPAITPTVYEQLLILIEDAKETAENVSVKANGITYEQDDNNVINIGTVLTDAPSDNKQYARKNGTWSEITATGGVTSVNGKTGVVVLNPSDIGAASESALSAYRTSSAQDVIDTAMQGNISSIQGKIPASATSENQLADKAFVNSSISSETAHYISNNGEPFISVAQLEAYTGTVTNNDYAIVTGTDEHGNTYYDRYKATVTAGTPPTITWAKEYRLNNSSFTAVQWAAINSGITPNLITNYNTHVADTTIHVTAENKSTWSAKYTKPNTGIPSTDMTSEVQNSLALADTAIQEHQSLAAYRTAAAQNIIDATKADNFVVTFSKSGNVWSCDRTFSQILSAIEAGKRVIGYNENFTALYPNVEYISTTQREGILFTLLVEDTLYPLTSNYKARYLFIDVLNNVNYHTSNKFLTQGEANLTAVSATGTSTNEVNYITIDEVEYKLAGGSEGPTTYLKTAAVSGNTLTITDQEDVPITFTPSITVDQTPTQSSTNPVSSGGTYNALADKVDKVSGKGLSTNDFTDAEKTKLTGIEANAEVNILEGVQVNGTDLVIDANKKVNIPVADGSNYGVSVNSYTTAEKTKLSGIEANADVTDGDNVKAALQSGSWSATEKTNACNTIGAQAYDSTILKQTDVVNNRTSTATNYPLSANQGKLLNDRIDNLSSIGRFLSLWNCSTGLAATQPTSLPYTYHTGDYFRVSVTALPYNHSVNFYGNEGVINASAMANTDSSTVMTISTFVNWLISNNHTTYATCFPASGTWGPQYNVEGIYSNLSTRFSLKVYNTTTQAYQTLDMVISELEGVTFTDTVTEASNYKPNGSTYTGTASTTVETSEVVSGDIYFYDGTTWALQINHLGAFVEDVEVNGSSVVSGGVAQINSIPASMVTGKLSDSQINSANAWNSLISCTDINVGSYGYTKNTGTITGITMNGDSKGTSGVVDLGTVITAHQSLAAYRTSSAQDAIDATKQPKHSTVIGALLSSGWSSSTQRIAVTGVTATNTVFVCPAPSSVPAWTEAGIYCSAQEAGYLTFTYTTAPSINISVNVVILN